MKYRWSIFVVVLILGLYGPVLAQPAHYTTSNAHSHNDYEQALPFYNAYARHFGSIEADIWAADGTLYVAHNHNQITKDRTLRKLYLDPLISQLTLNDGKAYDNGQPLQWLIDLKSSYREVMPLLTKVLQPYRKYFNCAHNPNAVRIVISGSMPPPDSLHVYDPIFTFDGRLGYPYPKEDFQKVTLVSADVQKLVSWKNDKLLDNSGQHRLQQVIDSIHQEHKLIRFWATPNSNEAYQLLMDMGVDYIGSDDLPRLECLLRNAKEK